MDPRPLESLPASGAGDSCRSGGSPRCARIRAKADFTRVFAEGRRQGDAVLAVHFLADDQPPRLGLAVSRKVDKRAVHRNRIKRRLRECFRQLRPRLAAGAYVVVARSGAARADGAALNAAFEQLLRRLRALPPPPPAGTMPAAARDVAREVPSVPAIPSAPAIDSTPSAPTSDDPGVTTLPAS